MALTAASLLRPACLALLALLAAVAPTAPGAPPDPARLAPGDFLWHPEIAPQGPIVVVVSLDEQRAYVYRNGLAIGVSTISSGKPGTETPTGVFTILQKHREHRSNLYDDAPMPYMQRLTWDGIALHAGSLPGHPASHGCVPLPLAFARRLFEATRTGDTVVVADGRSAPARLVHPAVLAPVDRQGAAAPVSASDGAAWNEAASPDGPVSVLASLADRRVVVLRNGVPIGEAPLDVEPGFTLGGTVLLVAGTGPQAPSGVPSAPGATAADAAQRRWTAHPVLGLDAEAVALLQRRLQQRPLRVDAGFEQRLRALLAPGGTVLLTDLPAVRPGADAPALQPVLQSAPALP